MLRAFTRVGCHETDYGVTAVRNGYRVLNGGVDEIPSDKSLAISGLDLIHCCGASQAFHSDDSESGSMNVERMRGVKSNSCKVCD